MGWIYTLLASGGELLMIWGLKQPGRVVTVLALLVSAVITGYFLNLAFGLLESSSVYPVWVSIGSVGAVLMGFCFYGEKLSRAQLGWVTLLLAGCGGLFVGGQ